MSIFYENTPNYTNAAIIVNENNIANNVKIIKKLVSPAKVMVVVKANAYGLGSVKVSEIVLNAGADALGVANAQEGIILRNNNIKAPILILSPIFKEDYVKVINNSLTPTFFTYKDSYNFNETCKDLNKTSNIHIKLDTGMNRIGFKVTNIESDVNTVIKDIIKISDLSNIKIEGMFTQFASSYSNNEFTNLQLKLYNKVITQLHQLSIIIPIKHVSNSGAVIKQPQLNMDMVRCGIMVYGMSPASNTQSVNELKSLGIKQVFEVMSRIAQVKTVKKGEGIGYSQSFIAPYDMQIATAPVGYADGLSRQLSNKGNVIINGVRCNIVGSICMDQFMIDVTQTSAKVGDKITVIGNNGSYTNLAEDIANLQGTINYEVATSLSLRIPTYYV